MSWSAVQLAGSPESVFSAWQSLRRATVAGNSRKTEKTGKPGTGQASRRPVNARSG